MNIDLINPDHRLALEVVNAMFVREQNRKHAEQVGVELPNINGKKTMVYLKHDTRSALMLAKMFGITSTTMHHILALRDPRHNGEWGTWYSELTRPQQASLENWVQKTRNIKS